MQQESIKKLDIKDCFEKLIETRKSIEIKILLMFINQNIKSVKLDNLYYWLAFKNLSIREMLLMIINPLLNSKSLICINYNQFSYGTLNHQNLVFILNDEKRKDIGKCIYFKLKSIDELCLEYELLLKKIDNYVLLLLKNNVDGLTVKEIILTLSKNIIHFGVFYDTYLSHLLIRNEVYYSNFDDFNRGYISNFDLRVKVSN